MSSGKRSTIPEGAFPRRSPRILWREVEGSIVLFHEDNGRAFALNETAARVWKLCDGTRPMDELSSQLRHATGEAPHEAVAALIDELAENGCVEMAGPPGQEAAVEPKTSEGPAPPPETWKVPVVEEIIFAACDCTGAGKGVMRNATCISIPRQQAS